MGRSWSQSQGRAPHRAQVPHTSQEQAAWHQFHSQEKWTALAAFGHRQRGKSQKDLEACGKVGKDPPGLPGGGKGVGVRKNVLFKQTPGPRWAPISMYRSCSHCGGTMGSVLILPACTKVTSSPDPCWILNSLYLPWAVSSPPMILPSILTASVTLFWPLPERVITSHCNPSVNSDASTFPLLSAFSTFFLVPPSTTPIQRALPTPVSSAL